MQLKRSASLAMVVGVAVAALLLSLFFGSLPRAYAQGPITVDGIAAPGEWGGEPLVKDSLDVRITAGHTCGGVAAGGKHPNEDPCFARSGYDVVAIWGNYQDLDKSWYFRLDVDGVPGDADSMQGTSSDALGYGTTDIDGGLLTAPDTDSLGLSDSEQYSLLFGPTPRALTQKAKLTLAPEGPGVVVKLGKPLSSVTGEVVYSKTVNPGIVEWRIDRDSLIPSGVLQPELWVGSTAGVNNDQVSDDSVEAIRVLAITVTNSCPTPLVVGTPAKFEITYSVNPSNTYPVASDAVITAPVPAGTKYESCAGGTGGVGTCSESGGVITWKLGTLKKGDSDTVSFSAVPSVTTGIATDAYMSIAEGLRAKASADGCTAEQLPTPTPVPPPTLPQSGGSTGNFAMIGLALLVGALAFVAGIYLDKRSRSKA